jgi:long-subunit fatty acid transport protein
MKIGGAKMKKIFRYSALSVMVMLAFLTGHAQEKLQLKLGYNINSPVGDFKNEISKTSFRGFNGELAYPLNDRLLIGLGVSYNDFYQKYPRQLLATKNGDISAVLSNSVQTTPIVAKVSYNFTREGLLRPYASLGGGVNLIQYNQYLGEFGDGKSAVKPAVIADAGVNFILSKFRGSGLNLGANFNYLPFNYNDVKNLNNWGVHAGIFFPLR